MNPFLNHRFYLLLPFVFIFLSCVPTELENPLSNERSPYLKVSRDDPIQWKVWEASAFKQSKLQNKLIYLSIGYATCFACEKMHRENYQNKEIAELLNQNFISIKVDREERPDIDSHFLNIQSLMMGFGAWPINLILTPDREPVFSFSYVKREKLKKILEEAQKLWQTKPEEVTEKGQEFLSRITPTLDVSEKFIKTKQLISDFYARYTHRFDPHFGGKRTGNNFNTKFPVYDEMRLLLRYHLNSREPQARKMVEKTLTSMAQSALFDHIGGGFHRYSMARNWNTPNFEKTLIDQAGHLRAYTDIYRFKGSDLYRITLEKMIQFLVNDMTDSLGGLYSSIGGSFREKEGLFYTWNSKELSSSLQNDEFRIFNEVYQLTSPIHHLNRRQTIYRKTSFDRSEVKPIEKKLYKARKKEGLPLIDEKIVTSSNALALSAMARTARLWNSRYIEKFVQKNLNYILTQHQTIHRKLYRRSLNGEVKGSSTLDDYAFLIDALIESYQVSFHESDLKKALDLQNRQDEIFYNSEKKLYQFNQKSLIEPLYLFRDSDKPSGLSMSFWNLLRLSYYFNEVSFRNKARDLMDAYPEILQTDPISYAFLLLAFDFYLSDPKTLIMVSDRETCQKTSSDFFNQIQFEFLFACKTGPSDLPLLKKKETTKEVPLTFYVCDQNTCSPPMTKETEVWEFVGR